MDGLSEREHDDLKKMGHRSSMDSKTVQKTAMDRPNSLPDFLVLYRSLVRDGALPGGYDREFLSLEPVVKAAARRENDKGDGKYEHLRSTMVGQLREGQSSEPTTYEDNRGTLCLGLCARTSTFPKQITKNPAFGALGSE